MRSRYTAYVLGEIDYVLSTQTEKGDRAETERWAKESEWLGLTIEETSEGGEEDDEGIVAFSARYKSDGEEITHRERAFFRKRKGRWIYAGEAKQKPIRSGPKIGRNEPCPCGSGKKYKKCCGG